VRRRSGHPVEVGRHRGWQAVALGWRTNVGDERGWTPQCYERWLADTLCRMFLPD